jgi:hypothetical protein
MILSTRVVFPWSTWAIIAIFLIPLIVGGVNWGAFYARLRTRESTTFFVVNRGFNVLREFNFSQGVWNGIFAG